MAAIAKIRSADRYKSRKARELHAKEIYAIALHSDHVDQLKAWLEGLEGVQLVRGGDLPEALAAIGVSVKWTDLQQRFKISAIGWYSLPRIAEAVSVG